jgi:hypothetical protein
VSEAFDCGTHEQRWELLEEIELVLRCYAGTYPHLIQFHDVWPLDLSERKKKSP